MALTATRPAAAHVQAATVPILRTGRLVLREPRFQDLDAVAGFMASPRAAFVGGTMTRHEAWRQMLNVFGHWQVRGYGYWTIEEAATGRIVGRSGVHYHEEEWPAPELGWQVFEGFEGLGYAQEAAVAARLQAARMGLDALISLVAPDNLRSRRLADRMGARVEGETVVMGKPVLIYRHPTVTDTAPEGSA
ncbi:GNAT family N-acetyltransferase [Paracoccus aminovorans]|uniref:GNAT family N-acetyltransferase n=1 Tax=Paracoccus aminovorans TaxID=34004 RepID=UPI002B25FD3B|nr:GNAT family N-acetyltransferase [Paracoccus aminovorans]